MKTECMNPKCFANATRRFANADLDVLVCDEHGAELAAVCILADVDFDMVPLERAA